MSAVRVGIWGVCFSALGCAPRQAQPPASQVSPVASSSAGAEGPSLAPSAAASVPFSPPAASVGREFQGYLGTHPIRATLQSKAEHATGASPDAESSSFSGGMRFLGKTTRQLRGKSESRTLLGEVYGFSIDECSFEMSDDRGAIVATIEGTCALMSGRLWSFRGVARAVGGNREESFALREILDPAVFDRYHRALLRTPRDAHDCPPLVGIEDVLKSKGGSTLLLYRLGFPCSETDPDPYADPAAVVGPVYLATIDESAPERFVRTGILLQESEFDDHFQLTRYAWATDLQAFELIQEHQSLKGRSAHHTLRLVAGPRLGAVLELPPDDYHPMGACGSLAHSFTLYQVDLDGRAPLDLLIQSVQDEISFECDAPSTTKTEVAYAAYTVDKNKLRFLPAPLPDKARLEALVANGKVPDAIPNSQ